MIWYHSNMDTKHGLCHRPTLWTCQPRLCGIIKVLGNGEKNPALSQKRKYWIRTLSTVEPLGINKRTEFVMFPWILKDVCFGTFRTFNLFNSTKSQKALNSCIFLMFFFFFQYLSHFRDGFIYTFCNICNFNLHLDADYSSSQRFIRGGFHRSMTRFPTDSSAGRILRVVHSFVFPVRRCLEVNHVMHSTQPLTLKRSVNITL